MGGWCINCFMDFCYRLGKNDWGIDGVVRGLKCKRCGFKCEKPGTKTHKGVKTEICPGCYWPGTLEVWEQPKTERIGRCSNCGHGSFKLAIVKSQLVRCCNKCLEVSNPDTGKILKKGKDVLEL